MKRKSLSRVRSLLFASVVSLIIAGCGGGSSTSVSSVTSTTSNGTTSVSTSVSISGTTVTLSGSVYDAAIPDANVTIKAVFSNGTEVSLGTVKADSTGNWTVSVPVPDNVTLIAEAEGTVNGKEVKFKSVLGRGETVIDIAEDNGGNVTSADIPDLVTSNISTVDYILSLLQSGGDLKDLTDNPEELLSAIKATKLEVRGKIAAAIKAYLDEGAVLNATATGGDTLSNLISALIRKAADGSLNSTEIQNIFQPGEELKVYKAQYDILNDPILKRVYTDTYKTGSVNGTQLYAALSGQTLYWKDYPDFYRKLTFNSNGTIDISYVVYNGTGWEALTPENASMWGFDFDPANWISNYGVLNDTLYITTWAGERYEVNLLDNTTSTYSILLINRGGLINWSALIRTANATGVPIVGAYGNFTYPDIETFRLAYSHCDASNATTCFLGKLELNGTAGVVSGNVTEPIPGAPIVPVVGEWKIDTTNRTLRVVLFGPSLDEADSSMVSNMVMSIYDSTLMGNYVGTQLFDFADFSETGNATLRDGLPLVYMSYDVLKLPLFRNEAEVQNFVPPSISMLASIEGNVTSTGSVELPLDARKMLCEIGSTDEGAVISCSSDYSAITITIGSSDYNVDNTGALINGSYVGHLVEITPFSFTANINNSTQTFTNSTKQSEVLGGIL